MDALRRCDDPESHRMLIWDAERPSSAASGACRDGVEVITPAPGEVQRAPRRAERHQVGFEVGVGDKRLVQRPGESLGTGPPERAAASRRARVASASSPPASSSTTA